MIKKVLKIILIIAAIFLLLIGGLIIFVKIKTGDAPKVEDTSIMIGIKAVNTKQYEVSQVITPEDFTVYEIYDNGAEVKANGSYIVYPERIIPGGDTATVTVTYTPVAEKETENTETESYSCDVELAVTRKKVKDLAYCGFPNKKDVVAVLYSNGELRFEGTGNCQTFPTDHFPWKDKEIKKKYPIYSVSFESTVQPEILDYWFADMEDLKYCGRLPSSVTSAAYAFQNCVSLTAAPDWSGCTNLWNISSVCEGCVNLENIPSPLPEGVRVAEKSFMNCSNLALSADHSRATNLGYLYLMYGNCSRLTKVLNIPSRGLSFLQTFYNCINIKEVPEIPETAQNMKETFYGCLSLTAAPTIPAGVITIEGCFSGCTHLDGTMLINANPDAYEGVFKGSVLATKLDITGESELLYDIALDGDNVNITVDGKTINEIKEIKMPKK